MPRIRPIPHGPDVPTGARDDRASALPAPRDGARRLEPDQARAVAAADGAEAQVIGDGGGDETFSEYRWTVPADLTASSAEHSRSPTGRAERRRRHHEHAGPRLYGHGLLQRRR